MTSLTPPESGAPAGDRLWQLLSRPGILCVPGAHNGLSGLLAKRAGFEALYLSGAALTASMGLPDLGIIEQGELCFFTQMITRATNLPLIVDGDTGYGGALNCMRLVRDLEKAGAAALQIEDQLLPKKCGHLSDKRLAEPQDMAARIAAAVRARSHLRIIARTDAAERSFNEAVARAKLYVEAGADIIFPEALRTPDDFERFAREVRVPLLANMTEFGKTPYLSAQQFEELGYKIVIWPVSNLRVGARAMDELYRHAFAVGGTKEMLDRMLSRKELYELIGYGNYEALDASIARSIVPPDQRE